MKQNSFYLEIDGKIVNLDNLIIWTNEYSDLKSLYNLSLFVGSFDSKEDLIDTFKKLNLINTNGNSIKLVKKSKDSTYVLSDVMLYNNDIRYMDKYSLTEFLKVHKDNMVSYNGENIKFIDYTKQIIMNEYKKVIQSIGDKISRSNKTSGLIKSQNYFMNEFNKLKRYDNPEDIINSYLYFGKTDRTINKTNLVKLTRLFMTIKKNIKGFEIDHGYYKNRDIVEYYQGIISKYTNEDIKSEPYKEDEFIEDVDADSKYNMDTTKRI